MVMSTVRSNQMICCSFMICNKATKSEDIMFSKFLLHESIVSRRHPVFLLRSCHREFNQDFLNGELPIAEKETRKCGGQKDIYVS